jgi:HSP20 family protein
MAADHELQVQHKREVESKEESTMPARLFLPQTDIFETSEALTLVLEMAGVDKGTSRSRLRTMC